MAGGSDGGAGDGGSWLLAVMVVLVVVSEAVMFVSLLRCAVIIIQLHCNELHYNTAAMQLLLTWCVLCNVGLVFCGCAT